MGLLDLDGIADEYDGSLCVCVCCFLKSQERSQDVSSISRLESQLQTTKHHPRLLVPRDHPCPECPGLHQSVTYQCPAIAAQVLHVNNIQKWALVHLRSGVKLLHRNTGYKGHLCYIFLLSALPGSGDFEMLDLLDPQFRDV